jgi:hypothetical protein
MFAHYCLLAEKRVTTPSHLSRKNCYISSIRWHAFISYMWVCYCTAKPLNPGWTYETRCIYPPPDTVFVNFPYKFRSKEEVIVIGSNLKFAWLASSRKRVGSHTTAAASVWTLCVVGSNNGSLDCVLSDHSTVLAQSNYRLARN